MNELVIGKALLRVAELCERMAQEMRSLALAVDDERLRTIGASTPTEALPSSGTQLARIFGEAIETDDRQEESRSADVLWRLEDSGYVREGTVIRLMAKRLPRGVNRLDSRFHAHVGRNPSRPIWSHTGESFRSLTALTEKLRDEFGARIPVTNFRATLYWCIDGEEPERSLASIADQIQV